MILTFKLDSNDMKGIKKLIALCENLLSFEESGKVELESENELESDVKEIKEEENKESESEIKIDDLRKELIKLAKDKGKKVAKELLNEFGVEKLTDVKTSDYKKLLEKICGVK